MVSSKYFGKQGLRISTSFMVHKSPTTFKRIMTVTESGIVQPHSEPHKPGLFLFLAGFSGKSGTHINHKFIFHDLKLIKIYLCFHSNCNEVILINSCTCPISTAAIVNAIIYSDPWLEIKFQQKATSIRFELQMKNHCWNGLWTCFIS